MRRIVVVCLAAAAALALPAGAHALPPLHVERGEDAAIVDDRGREVLLRGVNVNQLGDYFQADPRLPTTVALTEADFAAIAANGFNVVRLVMNWSALQPRRDTVDAAYVERIRQAVRWAAAHDLYVVLDMHQDAWGKHIATPPGATCPPGFGPAVGWDGAPQWATFTDGLTTCRAANTRELSPAVAQAFTSFYLDRAGIQTQFVETWRRIAAALAAEPNVAGYDLINEPHPGWGVGATQPTLLARLYARTIDALRAGERAAGAPVRIAFFEPTVLWSGLGTDALAPPGFTADEQIAFAPHLYLESISIDQQTGVSALSIEQGFDLAERAARLYRAPLWSGEWGWFGDPAAQRPRLERYAAQEDARALGGAWWVWRQACGDPHVAGYPGASGSLNPLECPSGRPLPAPEPFLQVLRRAYPRAAPGRISRVRSDHAAGTLLVEGRTAGARDGRLEAWVPGRARLRVSGARRPRIRRVPGGLLVSANVRGDYAVRITPRR